MNETEIRIACATEVGIVEGAAVWIDLSKSKPGEIPYYTSLPHYPTDANAALTLCDWLAERGWDCGLDNGLNKEWRCVFSRMGERPNGDMFAEQEHSHFAPTFPLAICGCFLKVQGKYQETTQP